MTRYGPGGVHDRRHCRRDGCLCTHGAPCDAGWLDVPPTTKHGVTYERVAPCPVCRPEAADRIAADLARTSRGAQ
jgi:hypothetical protein